MLAVERSCDRVHVIPATTVRGSSITVRGGRRSNSATNLRSFAADLGLAFVKCFRVAVIGVAQPGYGPIELAQPAGWRVVEVGNGRHYAEGN
jgi:hypothetical protein